MSRCKSCGAPIQWVRSGASGGPMPLDVAPNPKGNVVLTGHKAAGGPVARVVSEGEEPGRVRYMPHHATCPQGREWSGKGRSV